MTRAILLTLCAVLLVPLGSTLTPVPGASEVMAHPGPPHHHVRRTRRQRRVRVYRPRRRRPPVVIVTPAPPPVIIVEEAPPRRRVVVERAPAPVVRQRRVAKRRSDRTLIGVGLRAMGATLDGEKLGLSSAENPAMGGAGLYLRGRFTRSWGMELSADILNGSVDDFEQTTIPIMASLTHHFFPRSRFQPYVLAGAGVHLTRLDYLGGNYIYDMTEIAGQIGAGLEVFLTKNLAITADIRAQTIFKNVDTQARIHDDCLSVVNNRVGFCDNIHSANPDDKVNLGITFNAGLAWYF